MVKKDSLRVDLNYNVTSSEAASKGSIKGNFATLMRAISRFNPRIFILNLASSNALQRHENFINAAWLSPNYLRLILILTFDESRRVHLEKSIGAPKLYVFLGKFRRISGRRSASRGTMTEGRIFFCYRYK